MRVFIALFNGYWLGGQMIITAETQERAFELAKERIAHIGLAGKNEKFSMNNVIEFSTEKEDCYVLDNGDY